MIKVTEPHVEDIMVVDQNTSQPTFSVELNGSGYTMTGMVVTFTLQSKYSETAVYTFTTTGTSPKVTISGQTYTVDFSSVASGEYRYFVDVTDGTDLLTIQAGKLIKLTRGTQSNY